MNFPDPNAPIRDQEPTVLLALTVLGEAEGEPERGKAAVAHVVKNRMAKKGKTVAEVVLKRWQFSCWNNHTDRLAFLVETIDKQAKNIPLGMWAACWRAADEALRGLSSDPTEGATHYCVNSLWGRDDSGARTPAWHSRQELDAGNTKWTAAIGGHTFGTAA